MRKYSASDRPKLRWPLETEPFERDNQRYLVLKDNHGIAGVPACIPAACVPIISRFDGMTSIRAIASEGSSYGVTEELGIQLAEELERMGFLETDETRTRFESMKEEYRCLTVREAAFSGSVYPVDPTELHRTLTKYMSGVEARFRADTERPVFGLIAPHIDYQRGWKTYASAYSILDRVENPDVVFLLGTSHSGGESLFQLSRKDFKSPRTTFKAAAEVIDNLAAKYGTERSFRDEYLHRREHSLELQLPFLAHRYGDLAPALVPILVASFHEFLNAGVLPLENPEAADFIGAFAEELRELRAGGRRVLLYGGVDLAHMGLPFGDTSRMSDTELPVIEQRDRELLDAVLAADEERLFAHMAEDGDRRRVCGFPSIYTMLAASRMAGISLAGHLVEYRQAVDPVTDTIVTFASACWTEQH